jgi:hypothetical protein
LPHLDPEKQVNAESTRKRSLASIWAVPSENANMEINAKGIHTTTITKISSAERNVDVQAVGTNELMDILLVFERYPVWLLSMDPRRVRHLHVTGYPSRCSLVASLNKEGCPGSVIDRLLQRFGETRVSYVSPGASFEGKFVTLVSGSLYYVDRMCR